MGRVSSNGVSLSSAREATLGVLPGTPDWRQHEPNSIGRFGTTIAKVARSPISKARQRRKGSVSDLDSAVEFEADTTLSGVRDFAECFAFARAVGPDNFVATAVTSSGYTVPAMSAGAAGHFVYGGASAKTLVFARGFVNAANNGLKVITSAPSAGAVAVPVTGLTAETVGSGVLAEVAIAGIRAAAGDLSIDAQGNLTSAVLNFTLLGLTPGQSIHIGGLDILNQFDTDANYGFARIVSIAANKLTLDKRDQAFSTESGAGISIDLLFGQYVRNVDVDHADYREFSTQFELASPGLGDSLQTMFEYALGNYADAFSVRMPLTEKSTMTMGFIGTDTLPPSLSRAAGASTAKGPDQTAAFGTSSDLARLRAQDVDETGLTTDFKNLTLTLTNNVSAEKKLGKLGAAYINVGNIEVDIESTVIFSNYRVIERIRCNKTVGLDFAIRNADGGVLVDLPEGTLSGGDREYPANESVRLNTTFAAHKSGVFGHTIGFSFFPALPQVGCI